jgi:hypothetical protein
MNMRDLLKLFEQAATPAPPPATNTSSYTSPKGAQMGQTKMAQVAPKPAAPRPTVNPMAAKGKVDAMKGSDASATNTSTLGGPRGVQTTSAATPAATDTRGAAAMASRSAPAAGTTAALDQAKAGLAAGGAAPAAGPTPEYDPDTDPSLAAGKAELAKIEPVNVAASPKAGGYAQSATGAEGTSTQAAIPAATTQPVAGTTNVVSQTSDQIAKRGPGMMGFMEEELEEELEELAEMMRLSGLPLTEKAVSKQQQKFMGMVHAMQKGEKVKGASPELKKAAKGMSKSDARDFAKTKHKGLPQKIDESFKLMLDEEGHTLEHIVNRFKHEVKAFLSGDYMAENLYDALYDYYLDRGEMPYGVAKAREGDPYTWVSARFEADIDGTTDVKVPLGEVGHDDTLNELARLAGLSESRVDECGDMGMDQRDTINVSTNMSSDGTKSVNISAQGDKAEELLSMLKLAGMGSSDRPAMMVIGNDEEMMDEERETEYANTPEEEYQSVASITRQGNDLNREKRQYADKPKLGDNPMAEEVSLEEQFEELYNSVLVREADPKRPKGDTGIADIYTADKGIPPPSPDEGPVSKAPVAPKQPAAPKAPVAVPGIKR